MERRYTHEEMSEILHRALERSPDDEGVSHRELLETAKEVGLEPAEVERAIAQVEEQTALRRERDRWLAERRARLVRAWVSFALVGAVLAAVYMVAHAGWTGWLLLPWGLLLVRATLRLREGPSEKQLRRRIARRRSERRAAEVRAQLASGAQAFEQVVEQGVDAFLRALAEHRRRLEGGPRR
jgi:hypothetical protein